MEEDQLHKLKGQRAYYKGMFTRIENFLNEKKFTSIDLELQTDKLSQVSKTLEEIQKQIFLLDEESVEYELEDRFRSIMVRLKSTLNEMEEKESVTSRLTIKHIDADEPTKKTINILPQIDIPFFDGKDISMYKTFIDLFMAIVDKDVYLEPVQKLFYLRRYLKEEALKIVDTLPLCNESYMQALCLLKQRFDNEYIIITTHVNSILDITPIAKTTAPLIRDFVSSLRQNLGALRNMKLPVESWDMLLVPMLSRKLDPYSSRAFFAERDHKKLPTVTEFIEFLERRAVSLEEASKAHASSPTKAKFNNTSFNMSTNHNNNNFSPSTFSKTQCLFCQSNDHRLYKCEKFLLQSVNDRCNFVAKHKLCKICLNIHAKKCQFHFKCSFCGNKEHNSLLHYEEESNMASTLNTTLLSNSKTNLVMLPTVVARVRTNDGRIKLVRAVLDSGSQTSFITADIATELCLNRQTKHINIMTLGQHSNPVTECVNLKICSLNSAYNRDVELSIVKHITSPMPQVKVNVEALKIPNYIQLADPNFGIPGPISMLLAADVFFDALLPERHRVGSGQLVLQNTLFGYVVAGEVPQLSSSSVSFISHTLHCSNNDIDVMLEKFWEVENISSPNKAITAEQDLCEASFKKSIQLINNRFQVDLPVNVANNDFNNFELGNSFPKAYQRLITLQKRFSKDEYVRLEYVKFIDEYIESGHAQFYNYNSGTNIKDFYFLPHHPVIRHDKKTTKLRVVFDGSAKTSTGISLNDILHNGPVVQRELFDVLISFRTHKFVFLTDIKQMFRQIMIAPEFRKLQCILWKCNQDADIKIIQLNTVTYGLKSSSYLATRCLIELADRFGDEFPLAARALRENTYVDDVISGGPTLEETLRLRDQLIDLVRRGSFELHKWCANDVNILKGIPSCKHYFDDVDLNKDSLSMKALGVVYNVNGDQFKFIVPEAIASDNSSKATVLSCISRFYDPLGLIAPILVVAKIFLQKVWQAKLDWKDKLPIELQQEWTQYCNALQKMSPITVPRLVYYTDAKSIELIGFCDASLYAYGCCIYLRCINYDNSVIINLVCAKSRVAPLKNKLTIPKLELSSALLLSELYNKVKNILPTVHKTLLFTDSQVALAWIRDPDQNKLITFVHNRCKKILELSHVDMWHHVAGSCNAADVVSRGIDPSELANCDLWWHGPKILLDSDFAPTCYQAALNVAITDTVTVKNKIQLLPILENTSSLTKVTFVIGYVYRFVNNCRKTKAERSTNKNLSPKELQYSLLKIISCYQAINFSQEIQSIRNNEKINSNLRNLSPFIDSNNVLRMAGRLQNSDLPYNKKHPVILPKNCNITDLIIRNEHLSLLHAGPKMTLASLCLNYWIINSNREVKKIINRCVVCFKLRCKAASQLMGSLPKERITEARVFSNVGIDFCGPFQIKQSRIRKSIISKGYVLIFVCFSTKAIHMELASDLTTECFLSCLKRFISRRGLPANIYCDNGSTFKGANNKLNELYNSKDVDKIVNTTSKKGIKFNFIPSYSPVFGGLWEAGVKSAKYHFKRVIGQSALTYEQFNTVITEVEAILNSRPLTPFSSDPTDFTYLTPGHFLIGCPITMYPEPDCSTIPSNRLHFWRLCTQIKQCYWKAWHRQYLCQLQSRPKWMSTVPNINVGQLVILRKDNVPILEWPMARVVSTYPGPDGRVRVVEVVTPDKKVHKRSVTKISILPML